MSTSSDASRTPPTTELRRDEKGHFLFGDYVIAQRIGKGAFGVVRVGKHRVTGERIAAKIFQKDRLRARDLEDVRREAAHGRALQHRNIVKMYEVLEDDRFIILVQELASKGELQKAVPRNEGLPEHQARRWFREILLALSHCHTRNIAHLDIKPKNILLGAHNEIKLADFGLSERQDLPDRAPITHGSLRYAAPELFTGAAMNGLSIDMWACGVTLYYLLTGRHPFDVHTRKAAESGSDAGEEGSSEDSPRLTPRTQPTSPRREDAIADLRSLIRRGGFDMPQDISADAQSLLRQLLTLAPDDRLTVSEALLHPWTTTADATNDTPSPAARTSVSGMARKVGRAVTSIFSARVCRKRNAARGATL